jgi:hypothetical protein
MYFADKEVGGQFGVIENLKNILQSNLKIEYNPNKIKKLNL